MTDKPILFSGPMIRSLLDGRKTQERQILRPQPPEGMAMHRYYGDDAPRPDLRHTFGWMVPEADDLWPCNDADRIVPKYAVGDRLWVREAWRTAAAYNDLPPRDLSGESSIWYEADGKIETWGWPETGPAGRYRHARFMPRWASRLTLIVTDVRVQRVQDISAADAVAEGVEDSPRHMPVIAWKNYLSDTTAFITSIASFRSLWISIYGHYAWGANPWVAAYTFTVHRCNIDQI